MEPSPRSPHLLCLAAALLLGGCAQFRAAFDPVNMRESREQIERVDQHSSYPAIARQSFEQVNLVELVDPQAEARRQYAALWPKDDRDRGVQYDLVLAWFRESPTDLDKKRVHRNSVQDKILAVSTSRCNVFKTFLRRQQADTNFWLGTATTVSGVLGAVLGGVTASRNLAGAAGLFSGVQAEFNQSYYSNLAAHVIVQGIELRQSRLTRELVEQRHNQSVEQYSMEAAIKDALFIDGNCSAVAGLIEAQESIKQVENPGLYMASRAMVSALAMRTIMQGDLSDLQKSGKLDKLLALTATGVPSLMVSSTRAEPQAALRDALSLARDTPLRLAAIVRAHGDALQHAFAQKFKETPIADRGTVTDGAVQDAFVKSVGDELKKVLADKTKALPMCLAALQAPTTAFGAASADLLLAGNDAERIARQSKLDKTMADALASTRLVTLTAAAYESAIDSAAKAWETEWSKTGNFKSFDPARQPKVVIDDGKLSKVCASSPLVAS